MALTSLWWPIMSNFDSFNSNNSFNKIINLIAEIEAEGHQIWRWLSIFKRQQQHPCANVLAGWLDSMGY